VANRRKPILKIPVVVAIPNECVGVLREMAADEYTSLGAEVRKLVVRAVDEYRESRPAR
jgi:hypothetical protein